MGWGRQEAESKNLQREREKEKKRRAEEEERKRWMTRKKEKLPQLLKAGSSPSPPGLDEPASVGFCPHLQASLTKPHSLGE